MKAYSNDQRRKIVSAYERCHHSQREIAELFGISPATVRNFVREIARARHARPTAARRWRARPH